MNKIPEGQKTGFTEIFGGQVHHITNQPITGVDVFNKANVKNIIKDLNQRINDAADDILKGQQIQSIEVTFNVVGEANKETLKDIRSAQRKIIANTKLKYGEQVKVDFKINEDASSNAINFDVDAKEVEVEGEVKEGEG